MHEDQQDEALVVALLRCLDVNSVLRCAVDAPEGASSLLGASRIASVGSCSVDTLADSLGAGLLLFDLLWFHGHVSWHGLRGIAGTVGSAIDERRRTAKRLPILVVEGEPHEGPPAWSPPESLAAQFRRIDATKEGIRVAFAKLIEGRGYVHLWFPTGVGIGIALAEEEWCKLGPLASVVEVLTKGLAREQRRATEAIALAYDSLVQASTVSKDSKLSASTPQSNGKPEPFSELLTAQLQLAGASGLRGSRARVVSLANGDIFLLEGDRCRYVPSVVVSHALQCAFGAVLQVTQDVLDAYKPAAPVHVIRGSEGSHQLIVNGKRLPLHGFPEVVAAPESILRQIEALEPVTLGYASAPARQKSNWLRRIRRRFVRGFRRMATAPGGYRSPQANPRSPL